MAYLKAYSHDVFVSYASADQGIGIAEPGWTQAFTEKLKAAVEVELEDSEADLNFFIDRDLRLNRPLSDSLKDKVSRSAILIVVVGRKYLKSIWCRSEREWFAEALRAHTRRSESRVFLVAMELVDDLPEMFSGLMTYEFFERARRRPRRRTFAWPNPAVTDDKRFFDKLTLLADDVACEIRKIRDAEERPDSSSASTPAAKRGTFLSLTGPEMQAQRATVARLLLDRGLDLLPDETREDRLADPAIQERALADDLPRSRVLVQLLPQSCSVVTGVPPTWVTVQVERAEQCEIPVLYCLDFEVQGTTPPEYRSYLEGLAASAYVCPRISDLPAAIGRWLGDGAEDEATDVNLYLNANTEDLESITFAGRLKERLASLWERLPQREGRRLEVVLPDFALKARDFDTQRRRRLIECDGHCVLFGNADKEWVRSQLEEEERVAFDRRRAGRPQGPASRVIDGPPPTVRLEPERDVGAGATVLDFTQQISDLDLNQFLLEMVGVRGAPV